MINPSDINLCALPSVPLEDRSRFPQTPCIYFAIDSQDVIQYIGRSVNPKNRWVTHHKQAALQNVGSIKIAYLFVDSPELLPDIEAALIKWFHPTLNGYRRPANPRKKRETIKSSYLMDSDLKAETVRTANEDDRNETQQLHYLARLGLRYRAQMLRTPVDVPVNTSKEGELR